MMDERIPVILLKTKSSSDVYEAEFAAAKDGVTFEPVFVPVLDHQFKAPEMETFRKILNRRRIGKSETSKYGGLIFTSQRAVEAFRMLVLEGVEKGTGDYQDWPYLQDVPVYSVGPATTRALKAIPLDEPLHVYGSETGNGEGLAQFILSHYVDWYRDWDIKCPLLFIVGEQRQDAIVPILMDPARGSDRIPVVELDVYKTSVRQSFKDDFANHLAGTQACSARWVVVFSPTGCEAMLRVLNRLDFSARRTYVATIGPTTRDHLRNTFGFDPHVCAEKPTAESVLKGIQTYTFNRAHSRP